MDQRLHPAPDHRKAKAAGDTEMFHIIFIDAFGMIDEEAFEHMELSLSHAAVGNGRECNAISNKIKAEA
jgi:hypothetical protein